MELLFRSMDTASPIARRPSVSADTPLTGIRQRIRETQFAWFVLAVAGLMVLEPRFWILASYVVERILNIPVARPVLTGMPRVSPALPVALAAFLIFAFAGPKQRTTALIILVVPLALLDGGLDAPSAVPLLIVLGVAYLLMKLPLPRLYAAFLVAAFSLTSMVVLAVKLPGDAVDMFLGGWPVLMPMLWYSVYRLERRQLPASEFAGYMSCRLVGCPALTYDDLTQVPDETLTATRWSGMRTIYIAVFASIAQLFAGRLVGRFPLEKASGLALLVGSYADYVRYYLGIMVRFNVFIGVMRLFGFRIRDNFGSWLLARTPNEHWQRWNILTREWILTFVFFPIMRHRRQLFVAVMSALLVSGLLHMGPDFLTGGFSSSRLVVGTFYWAMNGLAIYAVLTIPKVWPSMMSRLRIGESWAWSVAGIVLTSCFYAIIHGMMDQSDSWAEVASYSARLFSLRIL